MWFKCKGYGVEVYFSLFLAIAPRNLSVSEIAYIFVMAHLNTFCLDY